jgi:hypothetical protein
VSVRRAGLDMACCRTFSNGLATAEEPFLDTLAGGLEGSIPSGLTGGGVARDDALERKSDLGRVQRSLSPRIRWRCPRSCAAPVRQPSYRPIEVLPLSVRRSGQHLDTAGGSSAESLPWAAIVRTMYDDDYISSEVYRLMPPRKRSEIREALDAANGTFPEPDELAEDFASPDFTPPREPWLRRFSGANWALIIAAVSVIVAVLAWLLPR